MCCPGALLPIGENEMLYQVYLYKFTEEYPYYKGVAHRYYWISRNPACVIDTLLVEAEPWEMVADLQAPNPHDNGLGEFFRARVVDTAGQSNLVITYFDRHLNYDSENEIVVPLSDTIVEYMNNDFHLDGFGDIIMTFALPLRGETHFVRIGTDGTLKHENIVPDTIIPILIPTTNPNSLWNHRGLRQCSSAPLRYHFFGNCWRPTPHGNTWFLGFELDSLFNVVKTYEFPTEHDQQPCASYGNTERMASCRDGGFLLLAHFDKHTHVAPYGIKDAGVQVSRYDADGNRMNYRNFKTIPEDLLQVHQCAMGNDLIEMDGYYYMSYTTGGLKSGEGSFVSLVKMDEDLNIIWQRFFLEGSSEKYRLATDMIKLKDGSIAVYGQNQNSDTEGFGCFYYLFNEKGMIGMAETESTVRPYAYWPNPAQDALHLHYSPDVKPTQIELYDLQGRLVRSQRNALESLTLQGLAPGTYTLRVTLDDGTVFTDKVVKE